MVTSRLLPLGLAASVLIAGSIGAFFLYDTSSGLLGQASTSLQKQAASTSSNSYYSPSSTSSTAIIAVTNSSGSCSYTALASPGNWNDSSTWKASGGAPAPPPNPIPQGCTVFIPPGPSSCLSVANATSGCAVKIPKGLTVINRGTIENGGYLGSNGTLANIGTGTIDDYRGTVTIGSSGFIYNNGTINVSAEFVNGGKLTNIGGTIVAIKGGVIENAGTLMNNNGRIVANNGSTINNNGGLISNAGAITNNLGASFRDINGGNTLNFLFGKITNMGALTNDGFLNNNGTLANDAGGTITNPKGATIYNAGGTINNAGTITNDGTIKNDGTIHNTGTISGSGSITGTPVAMLPGATNQTVPLTSSSRRVARAEAH